MADNPHETTFGAAVRHFCGRSVSANTRLEDWKKLPGKGPVVKFASGLTTRATYSITPEMIEEACRRTRHALEDPDGRRLRRSVGEAVTPIADWYPNFPIVHSLYFAVERLGRPPLWDEVIALWRQEEPLRSMLGLPAAFAVRAAVDAGHSQCDAREAMWWRLGNAYYSMLRELYVISVLRQGGWPVEYHVIADALFRADFWLGDTVVSLFVANAHYRDGRGRGRKLSARDVLGDCPDFRFVDMPRPTLHEYGTVHLPKRDSIEEFAATHLHDRRV